MAKDAVSQWSVIASENADVGGVGIAENCPPANINDAQREMMSQIREGVAALIQTKLVAAASSVEFSDLPEGYQNFQLRFRGLRPSTDDATIHFQVRTATGWQTNNYIFSGRVQLPSGGTDIGSTLDTFAIGIPLNRPVAGHGMSNQAGYHASGTIDFTTTAALRRSALIDCVYARNDPIEARSAIAGAWGSNTAITGVRLLVTAGNFAANGSVSLFGIPT